METWSCQLDRSFRPYDACFSEQIERAYQEGQARAIVNISGTRYIIDFKAMKQIREDNRKKHRSVARSGWSWELDGCFHPYDARVNEEIEQAYQEGSAFALVRLSDVHYIIDFKAMNQVRKDDHKKRRSVIRSGAQCQSPVPASMPSLPVGLKTKSMGDRFLYHLTTEDAAKSIVVSGFRNSKADSSRGYRPMFGEFIYFAGSANDCVGKSRTAKSLADGAVIRATVSLGFSLVCAETHPSPVEKSFLNIATWNDLTGDKLAKAGCQSVYATAPIVSRDEFAVPSSSQVRRIQVVGYQGSGTQHGGAPAQLQPWWNWPQWVHQLAANTSIDEVEVDRVAQAHSSSDTVAAASLHGVRINAAGRPIQSDGRFMSYAEARSRGWGGVPPESAAASTGSPQARSPDSKHAGHSKPHGSHGKGNSSHGGHSSTQSSANHNGKGGHHGHGSVNHHGKGGNHGSHRDLSTSARAPNAWNDFQHLHAGRGLSKSQMSQLYHQTARPHSAAPAPLHNAHGRAPNPWNVFTHANAGQGLSQRQMSAAYGSMNGASSSGSPAGGGLSWNAFQSSVGGQGYSKSEISGMYHTQK